MTHITFDTPLDAHLVDDEIVITGPNGINASMTLEAARASLTRLQRALDTLDEPRETYQKPLG